MDGLKLVKEAQVVFEEQAQVVDTKTAHDDSFQTHAKSKAAVFLWIHITNFQNFGVNHATTQKLDPSLAFTQPATFAMAGKALDVQFCAGLGEGEVMGAETNHRILAIKPFDENLQGAFEIRHGNAFVYNQALNLMEEGGVGGIHGIGTIDPAGSDDPDGRPLFLHDPDLHR